MVELINIKHSIFLKYLPLSTFSLLVSTFFPPCLDNAMVRWCEVSVLRCVDRTVECLRFYFLWWWAGGSKMVMVIFFRLFHPSLPISDNPCWGEVIALGGGQTRHQSLCSDGQTALCRQISKYCFCKTLFSQTSCHSDKRMQLWRSKNLTLQTLFSLRQTFCGFKIKTWFA